MVTGGGGGGGGGVCVCVCECVHVTCGVIRGVTFECGLQCRVTCAWLSCGGIDNT